jgi:hypothetical protein
MAVLALRTTVRSTVEDEMPKHRNLLVALAAGTLGLALAGPAAPVARAIGGDPLVTVGSPPSPFSQNKQNEPAVAIDANHPNILAAGANEEVDMEACAAGDPSTCPFTQGVGVSGIYFSFNAGTSWVQPTYTGWTARDCLGPAECVPHVGPIGTLPRYFENGLVSDGDPAVAFGPRPGADGSFSWTNGSRLYYANLTANFATTRTDQTFRGFEAIAVSHTDNLAAAAAGADSAWSQPVLVSRQSSTTFSDKEQIWADNAASSPHFGNAYVCWASFKSNSHGHAFPTPLNIARSSDGGTTWTVRQVGPATDNGINQQPDGCTVRTDSHGNVYVFGIAARRGSEFEAMYKSTDGGAHFGRLQLVAPAVSPGVFDAALGRPVMDGIAGARADLAAGPSVDIANGAPTGADATDRIVLSWADGRNGLNHEHLLFMTSTNGGASWTGPRAIESAGDRPIYTAPAISPNGTDVYVVYNAFTTPYRNNTTAPRSLTGVLLHADVSGGAVGAFAEVNRGPSGDPRGTSQNGLTAEFLGDYVYAAATRTYGTAVWNDASSAQVCPAIQAYRASVEAGGSMPAPDVQGSCPARFGNSDILGVTVPDPTP